MKPIEGYDTTRAATGEYETIEAAIFGELSLRQDSQGDLI